MFPRKEFSTEKEQQFNKNNIRFLFLVDALLHEINAKPI